MSGKPSGISGALGGIGSLSQLVRLLGAYFLPSSLYAPPEAMSSTGGVTTLLNSAIGYVRSLDGKTGNIQIKGSGSATIDDSVAATITVKVPTITPVYGASAALVGGTVTFNIPAGTFTHAPAVAVTAGVATSDKISWTRTNTTVVVTSSNGADTRTLDLLCIGNPN